MIHQVFGLSRHRQKADALDSLLAVFAVRKLSSFLLIIAC